MFNGNLFDAKESQLKALVANAYLGLRSQILGHKYVWPIIYISI